MLSFTAQATIGPNVYTISCYINEDDGAVSTFECKELDYLRADTLQKLVKEIRKIEHEAKRGFVNPKAYMIQSPGYGSVEKVSEVTVMSMRDERTAWVRYAKGKRGIEGLHRLYVDHNDVVQALAFKQAKHAEIAERLAALQMWVPIKKDSGKKASA